MIFKTIQGAFAQARKSLPELTHGSVLLGAGSYGLVIDHQDGTVSKILEHGPDKLSQAAREQGAANETLLLHHLNGKSLGHVSVPVLLTDLTPLDDDYFFATYRMTKLPGQPGNWETIVKDIATPQAQNHFFQAGQLLARFHAAARDFGDNGIKQSGLEYGGRILALPMADDETNAALAVASDYLQTNAESKIVHNDFHAIESSNIRVNDDMDIAGLLDFAEVSRVPNYLVDFRCIPAPGMRFALEGYEAETGIAIDRDMVALTHISRMSHILQAKNISEYEQGSYLNRLTQGLKRVTHITGFTPK